MKLYLMRHGEAVHPAVDSRVPLSERGRGEVLSTAQQLKKKHAVIDGIWHSPKTRAAETAALMAEALQLDDQMLASQPELEPEGPAAAVAQKINALETSGRYAGLLIVSHMPFLPHLNAVLTGVRRETGFDTAALICLSRHNGAWQAEWAVDPQQC